MTSVFDRDDEYYQTALTAVAEVLKMDNLHPGQKVMVINLLTQYEHAVDEIREVARKANNCPSDQRLEDLVNLAHRLDSETTVWDDEVLSEQPYTGQLNDPREVRDPREERIVRLQIQTP